ncbi:hypothetical protein L0F63_006218 [Massospora cicadina]|nr:hypothetical protein L0F63_006218 [Massospora cicadina]
MATGNQTGLATVPTNFTETHVRLYLERIGMDVKGGFPEPTLDNLTTMMEKHLMTFPFGNLSMFYYHRLDHPDPEQEGPNDVNDPLTTRGVSRHALDAFRKLVVLKRDGACLEQNAVFAGVISFLGYAVYSSMARSVIRARSGYNVIPATHVTLIAILEGKKYLVDVGHPTMECFGPVLIPETEEATSVPFEIPGNRKLRVVHRHLDGTTDSNAPYPSQLLVEVMNAGKWIPLYFFTTSPFFLSDVWILEEAYKRSPFSHFSYMTLRTRTSEPAGNLILYNNILVFRGYSGEIERTTLRTEEERRHAFLTKFNIHLHPKDEEHLPQQMIQQMPKCEPKEVRPRL